MLIAKEIHKVVVVWYTFGFAYVQRGQMTVHFLSNM